MNEEITKLIKDHPGRYKLGEVELVKWLDNLEPAELRINMTEAMRQDSENGYSEVYIFETLHEARKQMEKKFTFTSIIYSLFKAWQETGKEMYQGDAMENLANLDKFRKQ